MKRFIPAILFILMWVLCATAIYAETPTQVDFLIGGLTDSNGDPLASGKVYTYSAGTTTDKTTWQDAAKQTPHANPIVLDSQGKKQVFADGNYKFRIDNSLDVTQYTLDNLKFGQYGGSASYAGATTGSSNAYVATLSPALLALTNGTIIIFEANHTNTGAATLNVNGLGAIDLNRSDDTALTANEIISGNTYLAVYESSTNAWLLQNNSMPTWTSWTPTVTPEGTMTYTASITFAKYYRLGKLVYIKFSFQGTVAGTPTDSMRVTLPVTAANENIICAISIFDNSAYASGLTILASTSAFDIYRYNEADYTAGTATFAGYCFYEAAA